MKASGEFIEAVKETEKESRKIHIPRIVHDDNYRGQLSLKMWWRL
jgi:hypothetical protein